MQKYSESTFYFFIVFVHYPNFGIGDVVAGTTLVALIERTFIFYRGFRLPILTDEFVFHQYQLKKTHTHTHNIKNRKLKSYHCILRKQIILIS